MGDRETHNGTHDLIPVRWEAETGEPLKMFTDSWLP